MQKKTFKGKLIEQKNRWGKEERFYSHTDEQGIVHRIDYSPTKVLGNFYQFNALQPWANKISNNMDVCPSEAKTIIDNNLNGDFAKSVLDVFKVFDIVKNKAADEGNEKHDLIQNYLLGKEVVLTDDIKPAIELLNSLNIESIIDIETPLVNIETKSSCKADLVVRTKEGKNIIIDIKTGSDTKYDKLYKVALQLGAYKRLIENFYSIKIDELYCLQVNDDTKLINLAKNVDKYEEMYFDLHKKLLEIDEIKKRISLLVKEEE